MTDDSRRRFLLTLGATGLATLAGCSSDSGDLTDGGETTAGTTAETTTGEARRTLTTTPGEASVGLSSSQSGSTGSQSFSMTVDESLDGKTLDTVTVDYEGEFDLSGVESETVTVYIGSSLGEAKTATITDVSAGDSGTQVTLSFDSSLTLSESDTLIVEYEGVELPDREGEYLVSANVNDEYSDSGVVTVTDSPVEIRSTFDRNIDGWRISGDAQGGSSLPDHVTDDGTPEPCIKAVDDVEGGVWYFVAPAKFRVSSTDYYGGTLTYDIYQNNRSNQFSSPDVKLSGGPSDDGRTIIYDFGGTWSHPQTDWTSYAVRLDADAGWQLDDQDGDLATRADIETVLENVTDLQIRGEYVSGSDTGYLDNPTLWPPGTEPPTTQAPVTTTTTDG